MQIIPHVKYDSHPSTTASFRVKRREAYFKVLKEVCNIANSGNHGYFTCSVFHFYLFMRFIKLYTSVRPLQSIVLVVIYQSEYL